MRRDHIRSAVLWVPFALALSGAALGQTTPPQPAAAQPTLPQPLPGGSLSNNIKNIGADIGIGGKGAKPLVVHKHASRHHLRRYVRYERVYGPVERPALAGVELVEPLPHPRQPRHITVPTPAYPLENFVTFYTTPAPPVICRRARRDPDAPDPHLLYEQPVVCEADNP